MVPNPGVLPLILYVYGENYSKAFLRCDKAPIFERYDFNIGVKAMHHMYNHQNDKGTYLQPPFTP